MAVTAKQLAQDGATSGQVIAWDGAKWAPAAAGGATALASTAEGRLTLSSTDPVPTSDMTAQGTLYYLPYLGRKLSIYDGTAWQSLDVGASGVSASLAGTSANTNYDVFAASGVTLEFVAWTNDTTRATGLSAWDGVWTKSGDNTRRYLGTFRTVVANEGEDSEARRFVYNAANRVPRSLKAIDPASSWTYTTNAWRAANANTTYGQGRVGIVCGDPNGSKEPIHVTVAGNVFCTTNTGIASGVGVGTTSSNNAQVYGTYITGGNTNQYETTWAEYHGQIAAMFQFIQRMEFSDGGGGTTWYGSNSNNQSGLLGEVWA